MKHNTRLLGLTMLFTASPLCWSATTVAIDGFSTDQSFPAGSGIVAAGFGNISTPGSHGNGFPGGNILAGSSNSVVLSDSSCAIGIGNYLANQEASMAMGWENTMSFPQSVLGQSNILLGYSNRVVSGTDQILWGCILVGDNNESSVPNSWVIGRGNIGQSETVTLGNYAASVPNAALIVGKGTGSLRSNGLVVLKSGEVQVPGSISVGSSITSAGNQVVTASSSGVIAANGAPIFSLGVDGKVNFASNRPLAVTSTAASTSSSTGALTVAGGLGVATDSNIGGALKVAGNAHFAAAGVVITGLPPNATGTFYGPVSTGVNSQIVEYNFETSGDYMTADAILPLGLFQHGGSEIKIEISTPAGDPDSGSASFTLVGKSHWGTNPGHGSLTIMAHEAAGGAENIRIFGVNYHGATQLYVKYDAKRYSTESSTSLVRVKVNFRGTVNPQNRSYPFSQVHELEIVDSTTRANDGPMVKSITADEINLEGKTTLNGKVIISVPQGDISMGIYQ